jgi:hypothetical protein
MLKTGYEDNPRTNIISPFYRGTGWKEEEDYN